MSTPPSTDSTDERVVILNPVSGRGDHVSAVEESAALHGYAVHETDAAGEAVTLAREAAADGAEVVAAAGGDGTLNEVVRGVGEADALDRLTVGVVPCGTGNDFAGNVGVTGIEQAFEVLEHGDCRRLDLGVAAGRPFVNSCVGGLTADASAETSTELKGRLGTLAYVVETLRTLPSFDGIRVSVEAFEASDRSPSWSGSAVAVLVGNGRRFPPGGSTQANVEDGLVDVTVVEDTGSIDLMGRAAAERLLGRDTARTTRFRVPSLTVTVEGGDPIAFSLDGEVVHRQELSIHARSEALQLAVGEGYEPTPETHPTRGAT
jgi:YegS/Rv2252/BmrU family lipid kinase